MPLDKLRQGSKANRSAPDGQRHSMQSPPFGRSPVLESVERNAREQAEKNVPHARKASGNASRNGGAKRKMSLAAEETLERPVRARKSLPPMKSKISNAGIVDAPVRVRQRTGLTASWRVREENIAEPAVAPVQVISEEEQQKLQALEMQLPRVVGKIDSWLLAIVLGLLCIGLAL